ncbi:branched-chain amino acid ABC transporter permease [Actimicrobium sp. CCC2.4]|uniref:branched-chain amino acid ABC transporter permease n=1 Tax=Actimicrobium sp. CCC2.4 TaxID=3048606 RepID=UPI002AC93941|nr:branched-chain amino acid ABC transporter permease [Actimicrobium sp. CCC2.4]MEB0136554.1 branched-chain amino acid ABC transporter permease [Actimicrobium sp. CCC2.4]WPX31760.1 branched-chain amino acid ABC transporter permease [Actimicrobium sp. CCC2.4]
MNTLSIFKKPGIVLAIATLVITVYMWLFLHAETQLGVAILLITAVVATILSRRSGATQQLEQSAARRPGLARLWALGGILALVAAFYNEHFALLMICTVLLYTTACLGLTLQFGFSGVANFAGAAFFGIGSYTTAIMVTHTGVPHLLVIVLSGLIAALIGSLLILPVLRTRGHYAALVTIAFGILFKTFIEVNDVLGGPQGLQVPGMKLFGLAFNDGFSLFGIDFSFYVSYALLSLAMAAGVFVIVKALERSWIGLSMDVVRTDETAAATFGLHIARWKVVAFMMGNFFAGIAGSVYAMLMGFVAPNNFTFADSLLMLSIVILGGLGNPLGLIPAAIIVLVLPEKLQFIQEYRYLFYGVLVIAILLFRPDGLLPRKTRLFFQRGEKA